MRNGCKVCDNQLRPFTCEQKESFHYSILPQVVVYATLPIYQYYTVIIVNCKKISLEHSVRALNHASKTAQIILTMDT